MRVGRSCFSGAKTLAPKVCIVGSGPAGFYTAQQLIKTSREVCVDILERFPVPFGLVRFGVAPDHPEVKNVIHTFEKVASNQRVRFVGNVDVGKDVTIQQLKRNYNAVVLAYGAEQDRTLGIPGEELSNVVSARRFVGWYNGIPSDRDLAVDLDVDEAVVIGQGNVAMDVARILLTPVDRLKTTDITSHALEKLSTSKVRKVSLVGRRGPLQAAFTIAELRELINLEGCKTRWRSSDFQRVRDVVPSLLRPRKRLTELMLKSLDETAQREATKYLDFVFLRSPLEFQGDAKVKRIKTAVNRLLGDDFRNQVAEATEECEDIPCGLALRSIGYKSVQIDPEVPFDEKSGRVRNSAGKVNDVVYASGWVATGPTGVILTTMNNAFAVGDAVSKAMNVDEVKPGYEGLAKVLEANNVKPVSYDGWLKIDKEERERGKVLGKPREKILDVETMLEIAST